MLKVYNTLTRKKQEFVPQEPGKVGMYVCGVTPYNHPHIGNARPFVTWDVIKRYFRKKGFEVKHIQNFTDIILMLRIKCFFDRIYMLGVKFMEKISVVVPCYNEEKSIPLFFEEFNKSTKELSKKVDFEIIFVNDGSKDKTLELMRELNSKDERVKYISFSRNFGKESAIYAGLENASGDYVTLMDADLQDPPSLLPEMYKAVTEEDYDAVGTRRKNRKGEPIIRSFFSKLFYKMENILL